MATFSLTGDPERFALANELHARPFPQLAAPCRAVFLAIRPEGGAERDAEADRASLLALIDRYGAPHPPPGAQHHAADLGHFRLKWESHTEFVSYTAFSPGESEPPFAGDPLSPFPEDWRANLVGRVAAAAVVQVERAADREEAEARYDARFAPGFAPESASLGWVADGSALVATDFRLHEDGMARIAVIAVEGISEARLGRVVQRVLEIECYKSLALLALPVARRTAKQVTALNRRLAALTAAEEDPRATLDALTTLAREVERLSTETAFRFGAAGAYEAIVSDRIAALRAERARGRQLFSEFMGRRFAPAMRTVRSAERRLAELSDRVARASSLLSTRVQVRVGEQNQKLLESMDRRAALQLRLQQTVEGLSVVAISYYAVNLAAYLLAPLAKKGLGLDKTTLTAALAAPVILGVWLMVRRIRKHWE